jgi:hypothetical protein
MYSVWMDIFLQHDAGEKVGEDDKDSIGGLA